MLPVRRLNASLVKVRRINFGIFMKGSIVAAHCCAPPEAARGSGPLPTTAEITACIIEVTRQQGIGNGLSDNGASLGPCLVVVALPDSGPLNHLLS